LPIELPNSPCFVTRVTIDDRVGSDQGKTVLMLVNAVDGNCPPVGVVTQIALRTVTPSMDVRMTVLALLTCVHEHWINVALLASYFRVHAA
jgi:hypothetical protein